jgi:hypothetical protein
VWNSKDPLPALFDRTLVSSAAPKWDFASWVPELVVVALGTNDFSTAVKPTQAQYSTAYKAFLARMRGNYPAAQILCLTYEVDAYQKRYVDALVQEVAAGGDARVGRVHMPALNPSTDLGCHWHPNAAGHRKYADALIPEARKFLAGTWIGEPKGKGPGMGNREMTWPGPAFRWASAGGGAWADLRGRHLAWKE